jgi:hypothetical protein
MGQIIIMGLSGDAKVLPMTASKEKIVDAILDTPRTQVCAKCDVVMVEDWNLAPIGSNEDNTHRVYQDDTYLCDGCYDRWCEKHDIQPLEGE